jgi:hypothetical protein
MSPLRAITLKAATGAAAHAIFLTAAAGAEGIWIPAATLPTFVAMAGTVEPGAAARVALASASFTGALPRRQAASEEAAAAQALIWDAVLAGNSWV